MLKTNRPISTANANHSIRNSKKNYKQSKFASSGDESTSSEDTEIIYKHKKKVLRALSDYESDDNNIQIASSSLASSSKDNLNKVKVTKKPTFHSEISLISKQSYSSSSSDSEESIIFRNPRSRKSIRQLSDYETGESIDNVGDSLNMASVNHSLIDSTNLVEQTNDFHESSDNDSFDNIRRMKSKRPHYLSTSDTSDSDFPVRFHTLRKRTRMIASSEGSDDENLNFAQSSRPGNLNFPRSRRPRHRRSVRSLNRIVSSIRARPQMSRQQDRRRDEESGTEHDSSDNYRIGSVRSNENNGINSQPQLNRIGDTRNNANAESEQSNNRSSVLEPFRQRVQANNGVITLFYSQGERDENIFTISGRSSTTPNHQIVSSSDSDSSPPFRTRIRGSTVPILDSDSNNEQGLPSVSNNPGINYTDVRKINTVKLINKIVYENSSDSETDSEKCPICFSCFGSKEVASPGSCDHLFCTTCIQEWAKNNNTCPIDRKVFNKIMVRSCFNNEVIREIPVEDPLAQTRTWQMHTFFTDDEMDAQFPISDISSSDEDDEICCICFSSNSSGDLILCDFCDNIYHMSCLNPPLRYVPAGDWFCPSCVQNEYNLD